MRPKVHIDGEVPCRLADTEPEAAGDTGVGRVEIDGTKFLLRQSNKILDIGGRAGIGSLTDDAVSSRGGAPHGIGVDI